MSLGDATIQITGTVMGDVDLRYGQNKGTAVAKFRVLTQPREMNRQTGKWENLKGTSYFVTCFGQMAENLANSVGERTRVMVVGTIREREYEKDGVTKYAWDVTADEVGISPRFDTVKVQRMDRASRGEVATGAEDAWATR